jgi:hypothetical protein
VGLATAIERVLAADLLADEIDAEGAAGERARRIADANIQDSKHAEFHALDLVLVRPDQHVAWRADHAPAKPAGLIDRVRGMERGTP